MSKFIIREIENKDYERVLEIYAPYVRLTAITFEYNVPSLEEYIKRLNDIRKEFPCLVCEADGVVVGYAYAHKAYEKAAFGWDAEVTVYTDRSMTRKGVGTLLYDELIGILKKQNMVKAYALITGDNMRSKAFHEKYGFVLEGTLKKCGFKLGRWHDLDYYTLDIADQSYPPQMFIPYPKLKTMRKIK